MQVSDETASTESVRKGIEGTVDYSQMFNANNFSYPSVVRRVSCTASLQVLVYQYACQYSYISNTNLCTQVAAAL